ncbi:alpha/beta hydrolase family protein [Alteromonas antoniana]|uniref:alpha/beta hydrolase family protein n=1 Tax=Alteromonas antoniana TaxID=2803813 RepID=UPI001C453F43|nr:prolyl oligopeptidase family serine peptidase [Alteromonas antoniana]
MKSIFFLVGMLLTSSAFAQNKILNPQTCFRGPFENHQVWFDTLKEKKPNFNSEGFLKVFPESTFNEFKDKLECVDFTYEVDGLTVEGFYLKPKEHGDTPLPLVIYNRGGNAGFGYVVFGKKMQLIADIAMRGYAVIGSQYRGASRRFIENNGFDEFGGADVNDVVALTEVAKALPGVDASRYALVGWSRGVSQAYQASRQMENVSAIVAIAGVVDAEKSLAWRPKMEKVYQARIPGFDTNRSEELYKRSAIHWLDELPQQAPILLIHGSNDKRVNVTQSQHMAEALNSKGHPNKLVVYEGGSHSLSSHREEMLNQIIHFLDNSSGK